MREVTCEELQSEWRRARRRDLGPVWPFALLGAASVALAGLSWVWLVAVPL